MVCLVGILLVTVKIGKFQVVSWSLIFTKMDDFNDLWASSFNVKEYLIFKEIIDQKNPISNNYLAKTVLVPSNQVHLQS